MEIPWFACVLDSLEGESQEHAYLESFPNVLEAVDLCFGIPANSKSKDFRFPDKETMIRMLAFKFLSRKNLLFPQAFYWIRIIVLTIVDTEETSMPIHSNNYHLLSA